VDPGFLLLERRPRPGVVLLGHDQHLLAHVAQALLAPPPQRRQGALLQLTGGQGEPEQLLCKDGRKRPRCLVKEVGPEHKCIVEKRSFWTTERKHNQQGCESPNPYLLKVAAKDERI
jgi:hypothetical protein